MKKLLIAAALVATVSAPTMAGHSVKSGSDLRCKDYTDIINYATTGREHKRHTVFVAALFAIDDPTRYSGKWIASSDTEQAAIFKEIFFYCFNRPGSNEQLTTVIQNVMKVKK